MISPAAAFAQIKGLPAFRGMKPSDFRPLIFVQKFDGLAAAATSTNTSFAFPGGALILGITSNAVVPGVAAASGQSANNRQLYGLSFGYSTNESLVVGGPVLADTLLGGGDDTIFPSRVLHVAPQQNIMAQAANYTTSTLNVHVTYHTLVYRLGS